MSDISTAEPAAERSTLLAGDLRPALFWLALPVLCEQFLTFLVGFFDTYLSGRINADATAAIGLGAYVDWLAGMMFSLVGIGTTALVARYYGAGDRATANRIMNSSMVLAPLLGLIAFSIIFVAAPFLAGALDMSNETRGIIVRFLRLDGIGHMFSALTLIGAASLRGAGNMRTSMLILGFVSIANMFFSTAFVYGPGPFPALGIDGIVTGTVLARITGGLLMLSVLYRGASGLQFDRREFRLQGETVRRILRIGLPAAMDGLITWVGQFLFLIIVSKLATGPTGTAVFAAHVVGIRVEAITYLPAVAWGYASAAMIGQSLGAGDLDRAQRTGHEAVRQCGTLALVISIVFFVWAEPIYRLMHNDPQVVAAGINAFRLLAFFQVPLSISIIYVFSLRGAGDTRFPMLASLFSVLGVRLPVGYLCGIVLDGGLFGAWIGMCADIAVRATLVSIRFSRGKWKWTRV